MGRIFSNLTTTGFALRRAFPESTLAAIEEAIRQSELSHGGEIQFAIETALDLKQLLRGVTARDEAVQAFADLRVWDTEQNCGVLIYVLLSERDVEIVADRGFNGRVAQQEWQRVCDDVRTAFADGRFLAGSIDGIEGITRLIGRHFPRDPADQDELPNRPVVL
jgi:hypothetical protein